MQKHGKILVLGGTGAMGVYLVPELVEMGYTVDVVSLDDLHSCDPKLNYIVGNAMDDAYVETLLQSGYDACVDFMIYPTEHFKKRAPMFLDSLRHYIYLSSYRVYADKQTPITESAPRLLDVSTDERFLQSDDYSLKKARGEDILKQSGKTTWTAVRPAITYSKRRFQLITLEGRTFVDRALNGKKVLVPKEALDKQATMTWAGDVGKMIARLVLNKAAYGECYTVSTSEHHTWGEIAEYYKKLIGLEIVPVDKETFLKVIQPNPENRSDRWQLDYDRLFDRVVDNSKILKATGLVQSDLTRLYDGLKKELTALTSDVKWNTGNAKVNDFMDEYFNNHN